MCSNSTKWIPSHFYRSAVPKQRSKRSKVRVRRLTRRKRICDEKVGKEMEVKNMKLYLENRNMIEENEKLRKRAIQLHQENLALMSDFQKKFSHLHPSSTTLFLLLHNH